MLILKSWVRDIVVFMILFTTARNLVSNSKYAKYVSFIFGLLLVIFLAEPLIRIAGGEVPFDLNLEKNFAISEERDLADMLTSAEEVQAGRMLGEYKDALASQTEALLRQYGYYVVRLEFEMEENKEAEDFGSIVKVKGVIKEKSEKEQQKKNNDIHRKGNNLDERLPQDEAETEIGRNTNPAAELFVKNLLADFYRISIDNINISIQGEWDGG